MQPGLDGAPGAGRLTLPEDRPAAVPGLALAVRRRLPFGWRGFRKVAQTVPDRFDRLGTGAPRTRLWMVTHALRRR